jgi:hypothetical protein
VIAIAWVDKLFSALLVRLAACEWGPGLAPLSAQTQRRDRTGHAFAIHP